MGLAFVRFTVRRLKIPTDPKFPRFESAGTDDARERWREKSDLGDVSVWCINSETPIDHGSIEVCDLERESAGRITRAEEFERADLHIIIVDDHSAVARDPATAAGLRIVRNRQNRKLLRDEIDEDSSLAATGERESTGEFAAWFPGSPPVSKSLADGEPEDLIHGR